MNEYGHLYNPDQERDACGVGFVADISGARSHRILEMALECVPNLTHRGALDADAKTGDGAGVLFQIPQDFFVAEAAKLDGTLERPEDLGLGMVFLPDNGSAPDCRQALERARHLVVRHAQVALRVDRRDVRVDADWHVVASLMPGSLPASLPTPVSAPRSPLRAAP